MSWLQCHQPQSEYHCTNVGIVIKLHSKNLFTQWTKKNQCPSFVTGFKWICPIKKTEQYWWFSMLCCTLCQQGLHNTFTNCCNISLSLNNKTNQTKSTLITKISTSSNDAIIVKIKKSLNSPDKQTVTSGSFLVWRFTISYSVAWLSL